MTDISQIDWANHSAPISPHFTVGEALWLPNWGVYHFPTAGEQETILKTAQNAEKVRSIIGRPMVITSWLRPRVAHVSGPHNGENYNAAIKGAADSRHMYGDAIDFIVRGMKADVVRSVLVNHLDELEMCMEDLRGAGWIHCDWAPIEIVNGRRGGVRFFKP